MRARALLLPLLLAGCTSAPPTAGPRTPTDASCELTVIAWSDHLQRAVPATGTMTFLEDETTFALDTSAAGNPAAGHTVSGLESGRYRVTFKHRRTGAKTKGLDGEEVVYLEPGERRAVTVVVVDREDDIGLLVPASSSSKEAKRG